MKLICNNCKAEIANNATFCSNCGEMISEENKNTITDNGNLVTPLKEKEKVAREKIDIMGISIPMVFVSVFITILGYGGYITPLLLLAGVLLLAKVESKTLTSNFLVILALYASQFTIDTCVTFIASIPTKFLSWIAELGSSSLEFVTTINNISLGFTNIFGIISNIIGLCFFAMYVLSVISLFKSDKIKIPFITDLVKKIMK